jgi:hypothetical protein
MLGTFFWNGFHRMVLDATFKTIIYFVEELERIDQEDLTSFPWQYLGHGSFGDVFKAKMKGASVAIKILKEIQNPSKLNEGRILRYKKVIINSYKK